MPMLSELSPRLTPIAGHPAAIYQSLVFLCPKCRKHEILVNIWAGPARDKVEVGKIGDESIVLRLWHAEQAPGHGFDHLTITPSINREGLGDKCGGWHGSITKGVVSP